MSLASQGKSSYREKQGRDILRLLYRQPDLVVALDTETTGLGVPVDDKCIGVSLAFVHEGKGYKHYFAVGHETGQNVSERTYKMLKTVLEQDRELVFANRKFDVLSLETVGIYVDDNEFYDILDMAHLINENRPVRKSLEEVAKYYLKVEKGKIDDKFVNEEKKSGNRNITPEQMYEYAVVDAVLTYRIWSLLIRHREWLELPDGLWEHKQKFIRILTAFKRRGILLDLELTRSEADRGAQRMIELKEELGMDPAKPSQLKTLLLDELGLPVLKKSEKTGNPSFSKDVMIEYEHMLEHMDSPVAKLIKEFRGYQKAVSASFRPYLQRVSSDGRLRCNYNTNVTATGRLSCSEPNLQQIPKTSDKPWNGRVKECFVPSPGYVLINADFSQLELRIATGYSGEESLMEVFEEGRDIFDEMSEQLGMTRPDTKTMTYSIQYGAGINRIKTAFDVSRQEAAKMRDNFHETFPRFQALNAKCTELAEQNMEIHLWSGRKRRFMYRNDGYKAMNSLIQGGAADVVERVMVRMWEELDDGENFIMLGQVHDSVMAEIKEEYVDDLSQRMKEIMEDVDYVTAPGSFGVRFNVEVEPWVMKE